MFMLIFTSTFIVVQDVGTYHTDAHTVAFLHQVSLLCMDYFYVGHVILLHSCWVKSAAILHLVQ